MESWGHSAPARHFRRSTPRSVHFLGSIVHALSGGSSSFKPSIAVLPFTNMSGDHEKENFCGLAWSRRS